MTRLCFLCGKKIGFLRSLTDQQYCSAAHRREARLASTQVFREEEETELWSVVKSREKKNIGRPVTSPGQTASIFAFLTVAALLLAAMMLPGPDGPISTAISLDPGVKKGIMERAGDAIGEAIRSSAPVTLHHDFRTGLSGWSTAALPNLPQVDDPHNWLAGNSAGDTARGEKLHIWERSVTLQNYQMEFMGQVERRSLSWAFRATDARNYYATSLVITKPGPLPNAGLVRYVMLNGHEWDRVQLPLPVTLERGVNYRVRVTVENDHFVTYLNGQVISSWRDKRLHHGGVGFFDNTRDPQEIAWVSLSERDSFLGRVLAHFSLIMMPGLNSIGLNPARP
jgi:hypothetical protein